MALSFRSNARSQFFSRLDNAYDFTRHNAYCYCSYSISTVLKGLAVLICLFDGVDITCLNIGTLMVAARAQSFIYIKHILAQFQEPHFLRCSHCVCTPSLSSTDTTFISVFLTILSCSRVYIISVDVLCFLLNHVV